MLGILKYFYGVRSVTIVSWPAVSNIGEKYRLQGYAALLDAKKRAYLYEAKIERSHGRCGLVCKCNLSKARNIR